MGQFLGKFTEGETLPPAGYWKPHFEVSYGPPGKETVYVFTPDCFLLYARYEKFGGNLYWRVEVADLGGGLGEGLPYVAYFLVVKDGVPNSKYVGPPIAGPVDPEKPPPSPLYFEMEERKRAMRELAEIGKRLQVGPVPGSPWFYPLLGPLTRPKGKSDLSAVAEESPWFDFGVGGEGRRGSGWLGKLGFGPFGRGGDGGGPLVGHSPGSSNGGGSGGGLGSTKSAVDRPSDMGAGGGHGGDDSTSPDASSPGAPATGPQDRGTSASPGGPQSRTTNTSAGTESDGASADDDMIGVEYHNGREVRRWKVQQNRTPSETSDPSGLTGDPFLDSFAMRTARTEAGFISGRLGPVRGLYADAEGAGPPSVDAVSGIMNYDPLAPYASDIYEGRGPRGARGAVSSAGPSPYIEALYPEAGGDGGGETVHLVEGFMRDRPVAPGAGGDPHARVGGFTAVARTIAGAGKTSNANRK